MSSWPTANRGHDRCHARRRRADGGADRRDLVVSLAATPATPLSCTRPHAHETRPPCPPRGALRRGRAPVRGVQPDLALLDLRLPDGSGLDLLPQLAHAACPNAGHPDDRLRDRRGRGARHQARRPRLPAEAAQHGRPAPHRRRARSRKRSCAACSRTTGSREARGAGHRRHPRRAARRSQELRERAAPPVRAARATRRRRRCCHRRDRHRQGAGRAHAALQRAARATRPFIEINCAAIPEAPGRVRALRPRAAARSPTRKTARAGLFQAARPRHAVPRRGRLPAARRSR